MNKTTINQKAQFFYALLKKIPIAMRITLLLLFVLVFQLQAEQIYSQDTKISLNLKNSTIEKVLQTIEEKSDYYFLYNSKLIDVDRKVSIRVKNAAISDVLNELFKSQNVNYEVKGSQIILSPKEMYSQIMAVAEAAQQQKKTITGTVVDAAGEPIIGANIIEVGTTNGTITDMDGNFSLSVEPDATIRISYIGYLEQSIATAGQSAFSITLLEDTQALEEVVVIGYGTMRKVNVVGSISQISSEQIENRPVSLLSNALAGQMTGVTVIQSSGAPGTSPGTIRVRGVGSFGATPDALVLIDGIPGNINDVHPGEVESISVLKDAATAAIYGARAANGVILITTKAGKPSKVQVSYNGYAGFNSPTALPELLKSWDYALAFNEASGTETYSAEDIEKFKNGSDPDNYPNSNMLKEVISRNGFQTGHDLTLTGGSDMNHYYLAFGYLSQEGVVEKNNFTRYNTRLNMVSSLTPKLKVTTRLAGFYSKIKEPAVPGGKDVYRMDDGIIRNALRYPSVYATKLSNGDYGVGPELGGTPIAWMESPSFYEEPAWRFTGNVNVEYKPIKDLVLTAIGGYNFGQTETKLYRSTMRLNDNVMMGPSSLEQEEMRTLYETLQATMDYRKNISSHSFGVLLGYSFEKQEYRNMRGYRDKFPGNDLPYLDAGSPDNMQASGGGNDWAIQSLFGRLMYNYSEKYLFESTMRYDGSSRFPPTKKYGFFPSLAAGWRISEEPFIKENVSWISNLKLKASWGKLGNQNIGNYPWQSVYALGRDYVFGGVLNQGAAKTTLTDPNLHWESTQTMDGGFESSFFDNKLLFNAAYFYRKTTDILYRPTSSVSTVLGMNLSEMNTGSLKNTGWEFEIGYRNHTGDFKYNFNVNFTMINNEVLDLGVGNVIQPNGLVGNGVDLFIGYPMQLYYGLTTDGVFLDQADIDNWYANNDQSAINPKANAKPGDLRYVDISGDGKVDLANDRKVLGSQIPKYNFSFNFGFEYKNFDFSAMLQGVAGVEGMLRDWAGFAFFNLGTVQQWMWEGRFDPANPTRYPDYPRLQILGNSPGVNGEISDLWVLNASYLRVKNIQLGYSLPSGFSNRIGVDGCRFYTSVENPVTFDYYRKGWDPEINSGGPFYPILATWTFGVNIKF
jgi:TonB-linked SusC/RagA family outer membrane protein